jgi:hypothetical protein
MIRLLDKDAIGGAEVNMQSPKITVLIFGALYNLFYYLP